jgi:1,4-alpha-glucan branching enzyme
MKRQQTSASKSSQPMNKAKKRVVFKMVAAPTSRIFVAGDFNDWNPDTHPLRDRKGSGKFSRQAFLDPGETEYKFVVNGSWVTDPECRSSKPNGLGSNNSMMVVG